jgi:hypothetical protein
MKPAHRWAGFSPSLSLALLNPLKPFPSPALWYEASAACPGQLSADAMAGIALLLPGSML